MISHFKVPDNFDVDDWVFDFTPFGKCVFQPHGTWDPGTCNDIISFNPSVDTEELVRDLKLSATVSASLGSEIKSIVKKYWDCFCVRGCYQTILGYEFSIDTGTHTPVCSRKPSYGHHESKIIMEHINNLLRNKWARKCGGPWGSMIVLAAKPHQEDIEDIDKFVWRMCVSYRALNCITKPFTFPIARCDD